MDDQFKMFYRRSHQTKGMNMAILMKFIVNIRGGNEKGEQTASQNNRYCAIRFTQQKKNKMTNVGQRQYLQFFLNFMSWLSEALGSSMSSH